MRLPLIVASLFAVTAATIVRSPMAVLSVHAAASTVAYFNWYDNKSPGFTADYIHIVNPGAGTVTGSIALAGQSSIGFSIPAHSEGHYSFPKGTRGGPVTLSSSAPVVTSQRVTYMNSFNEVPGLAQADAVSDAFFPWYDNSSVGMVSDNIHVFNPGQVTAIGQVQVAGASPLGFSLASGSESVLSYPKGVMGGPVHMTTTAGAVIVTKRSAYASSITEVPVTKTPTGPGPLYLNWYDNSSWGFQNDNVHVVNVSPTPTTATVTVAGQSRSVDLPAGGAGYVTFPGILGGPATISAAAPIVASQRFLFHNELVESPAVPAAAASTETWLPWYDRASAGMSDDIHLLNPDTTTDSAVTVALADGTANPVTVPAGRDSFFHFASGTIGGPVHVQVTSGPPLIVTDRSLLYVPPPPPDNRMLNVPYFHQAYSLSCEEAALRMALASRGINVSEDQILNAEGIDWRSPYWDTSGAFHWGDPYANFVGDPNGSTANYSGYGTYHSTVARAARGFGATVLAEGENIPASAVYQAILDGHPVVAWTAFDWRLHSPTYYSAFDGRVVPFGQGWEHAVTVVGVTPGAVFVNNPWSGQQWIDKPTFEAAYGSLHQMAVIIS